MRPDVHIHSQTHTHTALYLANLHRQTQDSNLLHRKVSTIEFSTLGHPYEESFHEHKDSLIHNVPYYIEATR